MLRCMICKREKKTFNISSVCLGASLAIRNFIVELFGSVEDFLGEQRGVCGACLFLLNNLLQLKRYILHCISIDDSDESYKNNFEKFNNNYQTFVHNLQSANFTEGDKETEETSTSDHFPMQANVVPNVNNVSQTEKNLLNPVDPQVAEGNVNIQSNDKDQQEDENDATFDLLTPMYSEPFKEKRRKSLNRSDTPHADQEIENVLKPKKRRKKRAELFTRRKGKRCQSAFNERDRQSNVLPRPYTSHSQYNRSPSSSSEEYDEENYSNGDALQKETMTFMRDAKLNNFRNEFTCIEGCKEVYQSLDELTKHKTEDHGLMANYFCYECHYKKFTSQIDLNLHNDIKHHRLISHCLLCGEEMQNSRELQYHLVQHKMRSVGCQYCDKSFLDRKAYAKHVRLVHVGQKVVRRTNKHIIIDRINMKTIPHDTTNILGQHIVKELTQRPMNEQRTNSHRNFFINTLLYNPVHKKKSNSVLTSKESAPIITPPCETEVGGNPDRTQGEQDLHESNFEISNVEYEVEINSNTENQTKRLSESDLQTQNTEDRLNKKRPKKRKAKRVNENNGFCADTELTSDSSQSEGPPALELAEDNELNYEEEMVL